MPWTFITSIFLHADIEHLLFNMIALFFLWTWS
ncbi:MAG: rhomboid family intramembrane serine protease [Nitrososphaeria archaeon]